MTGSEAARNTIRNIVQRIVEGYRPEKIILFGSYANGEPDDDSDIDLLVVKETDKRPIDRWVEVKRLLRGIAPTVPVSPFVYTEEELAERIAIKDFFIDDVLKTGEVLYEAPGVSVP